MKKTFTALVSAVLAAFVFVMPQIVTAKEGRTEIPFEQNTLTERFDLYTETKSGESFFARGGFLYSTGKAENKAILKRPSDLADFTLEADFYPLDNDICPLDAGFYIYADGAGNNLDAISAYNVNLERGVRSNSLTVKIHRFGHGYLGEIAAVRVKWKGARVPLKVAARQGNIKVYVYGDATPVIDVDLTVWNAGSVGFRTFRGSGAKIGNFRLTAPNIDVDTNLLRSLIQEAEVKDPTAYTAVSFTALEEALTQAKAACAAEEQTAADMAAEALRKALTNLQKAYTFDYLTSRIAHAEKIAAEGEKLYTGNTFNSLKSVLLRAKNTDGEAGEEEISYMAQLLDKTLSNLTAYLS